jgi:hypothetical protein
VPVLLNLIPEMRFLPLFNEALRDVWRQKHTEREEQIKRTQETKSRLEERKQRLVDLLVDGALSQAEYENQAGRVGTALSELERQLPDALESIEEIESLVEFAEWMLIRVAGIWDSASIANKRRIQDAFFPDGLTVTSEGFGTAPSPLFFAEYAPIPIESEKVASPRGFEPLLSP